MCNYNCIATVGEHIHEYQNSLTKNLFFDIMAVHAVRSVTI